IKRWIAIGDSYTVGISAGRLLGHQITSDKVAFTVPGDLRDASKAYDLRFNPL
ncbi:hypothetical protein COCCADRAFT_104012, partial [Bipolaris zeicola 26-R-13]